MSTEYLTEQELAERLRRSAQTVARWRKAGKAPRSHRIGGRILYRLLDVQRWESDQAVAEGVPESVQSELDRFGKRLGLNMATSEGLQRLGRVLAEEEAERVQAEGNDRTDLGVA